MARFRAWRRFTRRQGESGGPTSGLRGHPETPFASGDPNTGRPTSPETPFAERRQAAGAGRSRTAEARSPIGIRASARGSVRRSFGEEHPQPGGFWPGGRSFRRPSSQNSSGQEPQSRPSLAAQAGHWPQPARAWRIWARMVCSAGEACEGSPLPPTAAHVPSENWYRP